MHIPRRASATPASGMLRSLTRSADLRASLRAIAFGRSSCTRPRDRRRRRRTPTLAVVDSLTADDLRACAARVAAWHDAGLATPLLLAAQRVRARRSTRSRSSSAPSSPTTRSSSGTDPFDGLRVDPADLRRACEVQARSHLLHLREGFLETRGRSDALADLIAAFGAAARRAAVRTSRGSRTAGGQRRTRRRPSSSDRSALPSGSLARHRAARRPQATCRPTMRGGLFPPYLDAVERLAGYIDRWRAA